MATREIGESVMEELRRLDKVAYVRLASVYRHFRDVGEFMSELRDLRREGMSARPRSSPTGPAGLGPSPPTRPPLRDNPRLIVLAIVALLLALVAMVAIAERSAELTPDFLSEVVLYARSVADLTMLVALVFVLARNIIKLFVERRRALPFARFRAKLVFALLGLTIVPALLVLVVGSELIRNSANRWFSPPIDQVLTSANAIAGDYYQERGRLVSEHAQRSRSVG